ncbi:methyltransferase domain-containing protein [Amycolatopsis rhabdoformis]|uniref:Methyltransferase domain-containing protein n=1 Tax=Amycolatopsis rhabdoformis TaxID=1448059 RepID=A0ABZ1HWW4_9PSEU|nr:methyltransferase domain-containing protein [Amycolatopsis rhabdoformis]WSE26334.1 methyltransferase domain-containing protein [Amycolatopsis rhabdoformis]
MADWEWDESLYSGSATYYARGRVAYPPALAEALADVLGLDGSGRLLDIGCGPGSLTLLLAGHFASTIGLDADQSMLDEAARLATEAGLTTTSWVRARAEHLPAGLGTFRLVTFAQSFHWLDRPRVAAAVHTMLTPDGACAHIHATTHRGLATPSATDDATYRTLPAGAPSATRGTTDVATPGKARDAANAAARRAIGGATAPAVTGDAADRVLPAPADGAIDAAARAGTDAAVRSATGGATRPVVTGDATDRVLPASADGAIDTAARPATDAAVRSAIGGATAPVVTGDAADLVLPAPADGAIDAAALAGTDAAARSATGDAADAATRSTSRSCTDAAARDNGDAADRSAAGGTADAAAHGAADAAARRATRGSADVAARATTHSTAGAAARATTRSTADPAAHAAARGTADSHTEPAPRRAVPDTAQGATHTTAENRTHHAADPAPPHDEITALVHHYLGSTRRAGRGTLPQGTPGGETEIYRAAGFSGPESISVPGPTVIRDIDDIVASVFSLSSSAPHLFGARRSAFEGDLRRLLGAASSSGKFREQMREFVVDVWRP